METITFDDIVKIQDFSSVGFDYASLDTEGSELEILKTIDLQKYKIPLFTIEHNYVSDQRALINSYMLDGGYKAVPVAHDDWFYNETYLEERNIGFVPDIEAINNFFAQRYG